ncbi:MAG: hypothetical protein HY430_01730 [Candidatus Levybacteria bacterium]|nr:hypothetical protein [Candidatus Levybacteria bacterium]
MDNLALQKIRDAVEKNDKIAVAVGKNPTIDDMAAALSLVLAFDQMQKKVAVASPTPPIVGLSSLVGIDRVKNSLDSAGGDLVVSFPYKEGEIEKVSYTIESGFLNIVVKAGQAGITFDQSDVRFRRGGGTPTVLIVVGTPRLSDLGTLFNPEALKETTVINIDNKAENQGFGDIVMVTPKASSVSEQVAQVLQYFGIDPDIDIAQNLLSGISFATDNFQNPKAGYVAFEMAAFLMKKGAVRARAPLSRNEERPQQSGQLMGEATSSLGASTPGANQPSSPTPSPKQQFPRDRKPPSDWLTPKVYKGSSALE